MTTHQIAQRLVTLCREGKAEQAQRELFADDAINIEPYGTPAFPRETRGLTAIVDKGRRFGAMIEQVHSITFSEPLVAAGSFAYAMRLDATLREHGRVVLDELCIYTVKEGKIISEQFTSRLEV